MQALHYLYYLHEKLHGNPLFIKVHAVSCKTTTLLNVNTSRKVFQELL